MKAEKEALDQILALASDGNVRAAVLNGSRANRNAPKDFMQDYDVALYVADLEKAESYRQNQDWVHNFGQLVMLQQNNFDDGTFIFLCQYADGLRIDLSFHDIKKINEDIKEDSLSVVLLDKDGAVTHCAEANESSYFVEKPTQQQWDETLNNLWWIQGYTAKELWRDELPLAKELYDQWLMKGLLDLTAWHIAVDKDWKVNVGHGSKWLKRLLSKDTYDRFISFYASADEEEQWVKLLHVGGFIREIGRPLAQKLGYEYPTDYDANMSAYIQKLRVLPKNAERFPE